MAVRVQDIDVYGRGVARDEGRIVFIEGALPDELVDYQPLKRQKAFS
ncbi:23S rRNA m(5)U1939 methyltransferase [Brevundimonas vesicularis]|uniref:23S rRNA m(5)U1939 methyltransferase n=1 Tax=Brevundimonas vesicularis TaxID=41276 RepID=A0A2X1C3N5_BREVE|nr:23S rRNA m(5)U1939 methyltransferase [Brevundimonas vesicularis]